MINYYIEQDNQIVLLDENKSRLENTLSFMPQYQGLEIKETERPLVLSEDGTYYVFADTDEYLQEQAQKRKALFNQEFFQTSLGYIRRNVNMANGSTKDFICDIVPALQAGLSQGKATPIITYKEPDFTQEATLEYMESLQEVKQITADFLQECALQLSKDFLPTPLTIEVTEDETDEVNSEVKTPDEGTTPDEDVEDSTTDSIEGDTEEVSPDNSNEVTDDETVRND